VQKAAQWLTVQIVHKMPEFHLNLQSSKYKTNEKTNENHVENSTAHEPTPPAHTEF